MSSLVNDGVTVTGSECQRCGHRSVPPAMYCSEGCGATHLNTVMSAVGTLYAYTTLHVPHPAFESPYRVGYVDLDDGPRLFGHLSQELPIGTRVVAKVEVSNSDGGDQILTTFSPVEESDEGVRK